MEAERPGTNMTAPIWKFTKKDSKTRDISFDSIEVVFAESESEPTESMINLHREQVQNILDAREGDTPNRTFKRVKNRETEN